MSNEKWYVLCAAIAFVSLFGGAQACTVKNYDSCVRAKVELVKAHEPLVAATLKCAMGGE